MTENPRLGLMQGCTLAPPGTDVWTLDRWCVWRSITEAGPWFEGANIFYRRPALEEAGGFNEAFVSWGEDTDLGWKVVDAGWERGFAPGAVAIHETEQRGWRHAARFAWRDRNLIRVAAAHPQLRHEGFWRPWAIHRQSVEFTAAVIGAAVALRWKPAVLLAVPYLWCRSPPLEDPDVVRDMFRIVAVDLARSAGHLTGSIMNRILVI
jgi:GT2 family glycosyltransferase